MTAHVYMPASVQADMEHHARTSYPQECCGLLIGTNTETDMFRITRIQHSENVTQGDPKQTFEIDPTLLIRTLKELRNTREDLIGYYHSHPDGPAHPSETDRASVLEAGKIWLIMAAPSETDQIETKGFVTIGEALPLGFRPVQLMIGAHLNEQ